MANALYYGDNLEVLREQIATGSVDLVYLDPPFNSNANYNVLFKAPGGEQSQAQIEAFEDTWHWNDHAELAFDEVMKSGNSNAADMLNAMRSFLGENDMMAYLAMMAVRLLELHRVLKNTGSLYLHCDPTASHYLKILLDSTFEPTNFRSEIIWKRTTAHSNVYSAYGDITDTIFFYSKGQSWTWNQLYRVQTESDIERAFPNIDADGRRWRSENMRNPGVRPNLLYSYTASNGVTYQPHPNGWTISLAKMKALDAEGLLHFPSKDGGRLRLKYYADKSPGIKLQNLWDDIPPIGAQAQERLGYPTQKPVALLERILSASSNEGDVVLDPFCGCGTTVHAAQKLNRQWIGIDVTHLAISLIEKRLKAAFPEVKYAVYGVPRDWDGARALALKDKHEFQKWSTIFMGATPYRDGKKGADGGIDGLIYFKPDGKKTERAIVSVKGGDNVSVAMVRDLKGVLDREKAPMGIFLSLAKPTQPMIAEAASAGLYDTGYGKFPKIQIVTIHDLFAGKKPQLPFGHSEGFKKAAKEQEDKQHKLI
jgi:site-specific DNA-methyltransferase (adenine-specific)